MTEAEWLSSDDHARMIQFLGSATSDRKLRLYLCAGRRLIWPLLYDEYSWESVEVAERFADGLADDEARTLAYYNAVIPTFGYFVSPSIWRRFTAGADQIPASVQRLLAMGILSEANLTNDTDAADSEGWDRVQAAAGLAEWCSARTITGDALTTELGLRWMALVGWSAGKLIRDIFGNPFRPVTFDPRWRSADVLGLALGIYRDLAFDRLPLLADALMDAGCADEQVIAHCRSEGPHARGCWVVDLVLGKE